MATHPSILAWRIPWSEEPGRLQSTGLKEADTTEATEHAHMRSTLRCGVEWRSRGCPRTSRCGPLVLSSDALVVYADLLSKQL